MIDGEQLAARLTCADRIERSRALNEILLTSFVPTSRMELARDGRVPTILTALIDPRTAEEVQCYSALLALCNLASDESLIELIAGTSDCAAFAAQLLEAEHPLLMTQALRLLNLLCPSKTVQSYLPQDAAFRRAILSLLGSHNIGVVAGAIDLVLRCVAGVGGPLFRDDMPLRDAIMHVSRSTDVSLARRAAACIACLSGTDTVGTAHHPAMADTLGALMATDDYELQSNALHSVYQLSLNDANLLPLAHSPSCLDGLALMLCSTELTLIALAAKTLANLCRNTENHLLIVQQPSVVHNVAECLMLSNEEIVLAATTVLWNVSARSELQAQVATAHPRLYSLLHSLLVSWTHSAPILLATTHCLHHLTAVAPGRDGVAAEEGMLDTLITTSEHAMPEVVLAAAGALQNLSFSPNLRLMLAHHPRYMNAVAAFLASPDDELRAAAASAVWNLAALPANRVHLWNLEHVIQPLQSLLNGLQLPTLELVTNTFWHLSSEPAVRDRMLELPGFLHALIDAHRVRLEEPVRKAILHILCNLSLNEALALQLPPVNGLLPVLTRSLLDDPPALQRPAVCALFHLSAPPTHRELIAAHPMCVPALTSLCRCGDETIEELAIGCLHNLTLTAPPRRLVMKDTAALEAAVTLWPSPKQAIVKYAATMVANVVQSPEYRLRVGGIPHVFALLCQLTSVASEDVVRAATLIFARLATEAPNRHAMLNSTACVGVLAGLLRHPNVSVQVSAATALWYLSSEEAGRARVALADGALDGFAELLHSPDTAAVEAVSSALWNCACEHSLSVRIASHPNVLPNMAGAIATRNKKVTKACLCALSHLAVTEDALHRISSTPQLLPAVLVALRNTLNQESGRWMPMDEADVQLPGATVLRALCAVLALARVVITAPSALTVLEALVRASDVAVSVAATTALQLAVQHPENRVPVAMHDYMIVTIIGAVQSRHSAIQAAAAPILPPLAFEPALHEMLVHAPGFVDTVLSLMRTADVALIGHGAATLWNLSACPTTRVELVQHPGLLDTITRVLMFRPAPTRTVVPGVPEYSDVLLAATSALCNLAIPGETRHLIASRRALLEATVSLLEHAHAPLREAARKTLARLFETTAASPEPVLPYLDSLVEMLRQKNQSLDVRRLMAQ